tara:strand:+ start:1101 stop:1547 length:447 start_codon:yes stop_codon:yes gene_type:complete
VLDPLTIVASITGALKAGKQIHQCAKEIGQFFDTCDNARRAHSKKRNSVFASANQEALSTWADVLAAKEAEEELELWVRNNKGWSAWQLMLQIRKEVKEERKKQEALAIKRRAEQQEAALTIAVVLLGAVALFGGMYLFFVYMGWVSL